MIKFKNILIGIKSIKTVIALLSCLIFQTFKAQNIVLNPSFESGNKTIENWTITGSVTSLIPKITIEDMALKMEGSSESVHGKARQTVVVSDRQTYSFSARFKTKDVISIDRSVMIKVTWYKEAENIGYHYIYDISEIKDGWFLASNKIKAIEGATTAQISLEFRWSTGTIWWDDISMESCPDSSPRVVKVGTVYCKPTGPTVGKNIEVIADLLDQAGMSGCQIVCLPEGWATCNTGIAMSKSEVNTLEGSASKMLSQKAKQYNMYIVSGLYSWVGDNLSNVAVLYNKEGEIQGVYSKTHLPDGEAQDGAVPGSSFPVFQTDFGKIGMLICWDYAFPEVSRILALKGAEILFCPIWGDVRGTDIWKIVSRGRAIDNGVYFINSIYDGHSMIINPAGDVLQESGVQGTLLTETIDLNFSPPWNWLGNEGRGDWKGVWRTDRRPEIYGEITKSISGELIGD